MKDPVALNLFMDISPQSDASSKGGSLAPTKRLFGKLLAKEIHGIRFSQDHRMGKSNKQCSIQKEWKIVESLTGLIGAGVMIPSTKGAALASILEKLGLTKEQITSLINKATDSNGLIHLDALARGVQSILAKRPSGDSNIGIGREYVPQLALAFLRLGGDLEAVKGALEKHGLAKAELEITDVVAMLKDLAPGLKLSEKDMEALLRNLGIPLRPQNLGSLAKELKGKEDILKIFQEPKDSSKGQSAVAKRKLAYVLRGKGLSPEKIKQILETTTFNSAKGARDNEKGEEVTEKQIEALLKSIRVKDKTNTKNLSLREQLKARLNEVAEASGDKPHKPMSQIKSIRVSISRPEESGNTQKSPITSALRNKPGKTTRISKLTSENKNQAPLVLDSNQNTLRSEAIEWVSPTVANWTNPYDTLQKVIEHLRWMVARGQHESKLTLHPPELGQIDLRVLVKQGHLQVQLGTEHPWAKEIVEGSLNVLRHHLTQAGFVVDKLEVMVGLGGGGFEASSGQGEQNERFSHSHNIQVSNHTEVIQDTKTPGVVLEHSHQLSIVV